ncbi:MBL fold metallo-hydrolase [Leptolyngbya sp. PCC 6406]|uniref:MBL fold metallo-hydrolase n=1 Tax=Leptolyngbya sp. PCC 6406 TaxID=1173264 RepID=UPI0002AC23F5|nr:MBL fold metallo-hydrolase [Leptolyngbya sp. PCC 6406]
MDRRRFVEQFGAGFVSALGLGLAANLLPAQAQTSGVEIRWLGHTCFLFSGSGRRILVNPFRALGCTAGYRVPNVSSDVVLISSRLFDEGGTLQGLPGNPDVLSEAGAYDLPPIRLQAISTPHDRQGGRRFGQNLIWRWQQGGLNIVHMGGAAAPMDIEEQILLGRPDVLLVPVGGGPKAYDAEEALEAIRTLNPRMVIPTHFRTRAADAAPAEACDIAGLQPFLDLMRTVPTRQAGGDSVTLTTANLPGGDGMIIQLLTYPFS